MAYSNSTKETRKGMGEKCDPSSDKWPGARVKQSRLNAGSDTNWRGSRKGSGKKSLVIK